MKKMILVFTMVCAAGQMYCMEPEQPKLGDMASLPTEVQVLIVQALHNSNNPDEAIQAIKNMSQTNKALNQMVNDVYFGNLKGFTALVGLINKKFPDIYRGRNTYRDQIAEQFETPVAKKYLELAMMFYGQVYYPSRAAENEKELQKIILIAKELLNKGFDPNFSYSRTTQTTLRSLLIEASQDTMLIPLVKVLLDAGATPDADYIKTLQNWINSNTTKGTAEDRIKPRRILLNLLKQYAK